jgi:hypothetical protein
MLFMVIERFRETNALAGSATSGAAPRPSQAGAAAVYERARERGRMMPDGLRYVDSWVDVGLRRCFQLMECDDASLLAVWVAAWSDLVDFEVVPVITSREAAALFA